MMNDVSSEPINSWYEVVDAKIRLSQGDIILDCPIVQWANSTIEGEKGSIDSHLESLVKATKADVIVMTQACDLENNKGN